jgi:hypothetical protein
MVHGYARIAMPAGQMEILGRRGRDFALYERLRQENVIPNSSVLLRRTVVDRIGWFDPHTLLVRSCDLDYWWRISRRCRIAYAPVDTGAELGPTLPDSLGNTHPDDGEEAGELMRCERDELLTPPRFLDRDVVAVPRGASRRLQAAIARAENRYRVRSGIVGPSAGTEPTPPPDDQRLVVLGSGASLSLVFDGLFRNRGPVQRIYDPSPARWLDVRPLLQATVVIFDARLFANPYGHRVATACRALRIPVYCFIDDNFFVLREERRYPRFAAFGGARTVDAFRRLDGLIVTSEALRDDMKARQLNDNLLMMGPAIDRRFLPVPEPMPVGGREPLRIAVPGGQHRDEFFGDVIVPALNSLSADVPIVVTMRADATAGRQRLHRRIQIETHAPVDSFGEFLHEWRRRPHHLLLHPRGYTKNIDYKTDNALLVAHYLGAVPIVADERAYAATSESDGVTKVADDTPEGWRRAITRLMATRERMEAGARLAAYCARRFDPAHNEAVLQRLLDHHPVCDPELFASRTAIAADLERETQQQASGFLTRAAVTAWRWLPSDLKRLLAPAACRIATVIFREDTSRD